MHQQDATTQDDPFAKAACTTLECLVFIMCNRMLVLIPAHMQAVEQPLFAVAACESGVNHVLAYTFYAALCRQIAGCQIAAPEVSQRTAGIP